MTLARLSARGVDHCRAFVEAHLVNGGCTVERLKQRNARRDNTRRFAIETGRIPTSLAKALERFSIFGSVLGVHRGSRTC